MRAACVSTYHGWNYQHRARHDLARGASYRNMPSTRECALRDDDRRHAKKLKVPRNRQLRVISGSDSRWIKKRFASDMRHLRVRRHDYTYKKAHYHQRETPCAGTLYVSDSKERGESLHGSTHIPQSNQHQPVQRTTHGRYEETSSCRIRTAYENRDDTRGEASLDQVPPPLPLTVRCPKGDRSLHP